MGSGKAGVSSEATTTNKMRANVLLIIMTVSVQGSKVVRMYRSVMASF